MWGFATTPLSGWHTCGEDFSFRVGLLPFLAKMDFLPISTYFESQATPLSKPHGHAILLTSVPSSTLLYLQPKFRILIFLFLYFLIFLFSYMLYISIQFYKDIMLCSYIYIGQYLYVNILLFLYLCFHICFYCSTSLFYGSGSVTSASLAFSRAKLWRPCQMPSTRRDLLIWLKLSWKPSANNSYLGIPEKFLPNSLAF